MLSSSGIGKKTALILADIGYTTWTIPDLAKWINLACVDLVQAKPSALTAKAAMQLEAGTSQTLDGATFVDPFGQPLSLRPLQLLEVVRNMGADGTIPGPAVVGIDRKVLDVALPGWHAVPAGSAIQFVMFNPKFPKSFFNYPAATTSPAMFLEVVLSRLPNNTLSDDATVLGTNDIDAGLDDVYESPLVDNVLYRALSQDTENQFYLQRSQNHYRAFATALGVRLQNEARQRPERQFDAPTGE